MELFKGTYFAFVTLLTFLQGSVLAQTAYDCSVLDPIDDINMFVLGPSLVVVWQEPKNMQPCNFTNIEHTVTYKSYQLLQQVVTRNYFVYFDYYPYQCVPGVVNITAHTDALTSKPSMVEYYVETTSVENLTLAEESGTLVAKWTNPNNSDKCNFTYKLTYKNHLQEFMVNTTNLTTALNVSLIPCIQSKLTVTPVNGKYVGVATTMEYEQALSTVRNYHLTSANGEVVAVFDPPADIEYCNLTYEVREVETRCYTKTVNVAAFNGRIYSRWASAEIEQDISAVESLSATVYGDNIIVNWTEVQDASSCSVTYQIRYNDILYTTDISQITLPSALAACVESTITVNPMSSTGKLGGTSQLHLKGELGGVKDLALSNAGDIISAQWTVPDNSTFCVISYLLEYTNQNGSHWYVTEKTSFDLQYTSCAAPVRLTVEPHGEDGSVGTARTVSLAASC